MKNKVIQHLIQLILPPSQNSKVTDITFKFKNMVRFHNLDFNFASEAELGLISCQDEDRHQVHFLT